MTAELFKGTKHALLYSKFRPSPPEDFIRSIIKFVGEKIQGPFKQAIDIGCGSGQSTIVLASHFEKVTGFDISEAQIKAAEKDRSLPNIKYKTADCYQLPLPKSSVQLVTSSQAVHWFDFEKLFTEVKRILVPNGVIAVYGYWIPLPQIEDEKKTRKIKDLICEEYHEKQLGKYWNAERYIVKSQYADLVFPFKDVHRLKLVHKTESSLTDYISYLRTWSAYQKICQENNSKAESIVKDIESQLISILNIKKPAEEIVFQLDSDFFLLMGRN